MTTQVDVWMTLNLIKLEISLTNIFRRAYSICYNFPILLLPLNQNVLHCAEFYFMHSLILNLNYSFVHSFGLNYIKIDVEYDKI